MYQMTVLGKDWKASFELQEDGSCRCLHLTKPVEESGSGAERTGDCLKITCWEPGKQNLVEDQWMVLAGSFAGILQEIHTNWQMAKLESPAIISCFRAAEAIDPEAKNQPILITYYVSAPSPIMGRTKIHRAMRASIYKVMETLYGSTYGEVHLLPVNESDPQNESDNRMHPSWMEGKNPAELQQAERGGKNNEH